MRTKLALALLVAIAAGVAPAGADHADACTDDYFCDSRGTVWTADATFARGEGTITVETSRHDLERLSSEGHTQTSEVSVQVRYEEPGALSWACVADPDNVTYEASDVIHVVSTQEGCSLDLTWTNTGTPTPSAQRTTTVTPGIPTQFTTIVIVSGALTIDADADVAGSVQGEDVSAAGGGETSRHEYVGHVTLFP